jgi:DNA-binding beta-propeller fold protein YncE
MNTKGPRNWNQANFYGASSLLVLVGLYWCQTLYADPSPYITTNKPTVLLSVNDGESIALLADLQNGEQAENPLITEDSITVFRLFSDQPPVINTVYGTTSSTIAGSPHAAIVGRFGVITNHNWRFGETKSPDVAGQNQVISIDLEADDLPVVSRIELEKQPWQAIAHPDGQRVIVALSDHWSVLKVEDNGALVEVAKSPTPGFVYSFDLGVDGKTIIAAMVKGSDLMSDETGIFRFTVNDDNSVTVTGEITSDEFVIDGPFSPRVSPDGSRALVLNSLGGSDGVPDDVLVVDLADNSVLHAIAGVCDGLESLAIHPSGEWAAISCLDMFGATTTSHLAVIQLNEDSAQLLYHLPVEPVPEGIEFTSDGTKLFVGSTAANHIAVFDVEGTRLVRSPYVLPTGYGHSLLGIATN